MHCAIVAVRAETRESTQLPIHDGPTCRVVLVYVVPLSRVAKCLRDTTARHMSAASVGPGHSASTVAATGRTDRVAATISPCTVRVMSAV